jgi:hypothetical protein
MEAIEMDNGIEMGEEEKKSLVAIMGLEGEVCVFVSLA